MCIEPGSGFSLAYMQCTQEDGSSVTELDGATEESCDASWDYVLCGSMGQYMIDDPSLCDDPRTAQVPTCFGDDDTQCTFLLTSMHNSF